MNKLAKAFWIALGSLTLALGTLGIFLPLLPTVPLYLVTAFSYAKSSEKLNKWFRTTGLYRRYLESYTQNRSMTLSLKIILIVTLAVSLTLAMIFTWHIFFLRFVHPTVFVLLSGYFIFGIKTAKKKPSDTESESQQQKETATHQ